MKNKKGYTLIEVLMVLSILIIILGLAIPKIGYLGELKEQRELSRFKKDLLFTRNKAIVESRNYFVSLDTDVNGYRIRPENDLKVSLSVDFTSGIEIDKNNQLKSFTFLYNGTTKNSGTIYLRSQKDNLYKLTISPVTGRINIELLD